MHELSIALSILDLAETEAARRGGVRITAIHLKLGPLAGVVKEALLSAYDLAREGASCKDAVLCIEEVPIVVYCPSCAAERTPLSLQQLCCGACGTPTPRIVSGRELDVVALEIES
jgi:hydrogenase nickel incorporation protein HypA/HybF